MRFEINDQVKYIGDGIGRWTRYFNGRHPSGLGHPHLGHCEKGDEGQIVEIDSIIRNDYESYMICWNKGGFTWMSKSELEMVNV